MPSKAQGTNHEPHHRNRRRVHLPLSVCHLLILLLDPLAATTAADEQSRRRKIKPITDLSFHIAAGRLLRKRTQRVSQHKLVNLFPAVVQVGKNANSRLG